MNWKMTLFVDARDDADFTNGEKKEGFVSFEH